MKKPLDALSMGMPSTTITPIIVLCCVILAKSIQFLTASHLSIALPVSEFTYVAISFKPFTVAFRSKDLTFLYCRLSFLQALLLKWVFLQH